MSSPPDRDTLYAHIAQGFGGWLVLWALMTLWEPSSNTLAQLGLLVSSKKEHLVGLPLQDTGLTMRSILAIIAVGIVIGFAYGYVRYIAPKNPDEPAPRPAARQMPQYDAPPPMPPMGGGYGAPPYPVQGGGYMPPGYGNQPPPGLFNT